MQLLDEGQRIRMMMPQRLSRYLFSLGCRLVNQQKGADSPNSTAIPQIGHRKFCLHLADGIRGMEGKKGSSGSRDGW